MIPQGQRVIVLQNEDEMADFMIKKWKEVSRAAIEEEGFLTVALSGGKTPIPLYQRLALLKEGLPWEKTHIFLVDERFLPFQHPDSNFHMLKDTLLDQVPIPRQNIHPVPAGEATPQIAARKYEEDLRTFFKLAPDELPELDLILLGVGKDGHTASLFPGRLPINEPGQLVAAVMLDEMRHNRITLTLPVINQAKTIIFLVTGKNKAEVLGKVIYKKDSTLPASLVAPQTGNLIFLSDLEASSQLSFQKEGSQGDACRNCCRPRRV
jgi:6-phosphogluconolactonase